jgi:hypothetical protein
VIPRSVAAGGTLNPAKAGLYGHGLLGSLTEVDGQITRTNNLGNMHNSLWCATNWSGFSTEDQSWVLFSLRDLSNFRKLVDRMQQGFVHMLYLGRAMAHPDGLRDDPAFEIDPDGIGGNPPGSAFESTDDLYWEGISQGAIMGGALTALAPDFTRSVLNVGGMNYSTLLRRSVDFDDYAHGIFFGNQTPFGLYTNYPSELERPLTISLMQLLWDRGESNGYAHHITTDPLPDTPQHQILSQLALGDHQVANLTAEIMARTTGQRIYTPALDPGRHWESNPFMGLDPIDFGNPAAPDPFEGSALVYYDGGPLSWFNNGSGPGAAAECSHGDPATDPCQGTDPPPNANVPNRSGDDPHGYPRRSIDGLTHVTDFLQPNGFILPCLGPGPSIRPCYANGWDGP